jgi:mRNA interferase HigB
MVILTKTKLANFYNLEHKAKEPLLLWYHKTQLSDWRNFHDIRETFNSVDSVGNDHFVFNIGGNKYRLVAVVHFDIRTVYVKFVGTHKQYDKIDCRTI